MFAFLKDNSYVNSPCVGECFPLTDVSDPVFSGKVMGDGVAFHLDSGEIYAPVNGQIIMVADTKHALGIKAKNNAEILIHVGLDTVNYGGQGFISFVKAGDKIKKGQLLLKIDMDFFKTKNVDMSVPMIITSPEYQLSEVTYGKVTTAVNIFKLIKG